MPDWDLTAPVPAVIPPGERRWSLTDPATAVLLGGSRNFTGEDVSESSLLSLSGFYRAIMVICQAGGSLPLKSYRQDSDGTRERVSTWLDNPAGPDELMTPFQWKEQVLLHAIIHGEADLYHIRNGAGAIVGLQPVHPSAVAVYEDPDVRGGERYTVSMANGQNLQLTPYGDTANDPGMTRIVGPRTRGRRGMSLMARAGNSIGIALAAERATANLFAKGALVQGVLTPDDNENIDSDDAEALRADLDRHVFGADNAGSVPLVNRILKFVSWQMNNVDAQFLENRQFQIEEAARWLGVPPFMLMQLDKQSSWGTGLAENNRQFAQYVLLPWLMRIAETLSRLLTRPTWCEFDMSGLEAGSAADEIALLMSQVNGGFLTLNEARRVRNLAPVDGGDALRIPSGVMLQAQLEASAAATEAEIGEGSADGT